MNEELIVEALVEKLDTVQSFVHKHIEKFDCSKRKIMQMDLIVEEIFINIASYAYAPNIGSVKILLNVDSDSKIVSMTFIDSGVEYNPLQKSDPDVNLSVEEREIGGLGIYLTKNLVDSISYQYVDGKNILQFTKLLSD